MMFPSLMLKLSLVMNTHLVIVKKMIKQGWAPPDEAWRGPPRSAVGTVASCYSAGCTRTCPMLYPCLAFWTVRVTPYGSVGLPVPRMMLLPRFSP